MHCIIWAKKVLFYSLILFISFCIIDNTKAQSNKQRPPNVLFIVVDDLNDWIGTLGGHPDVKTPNMDALAESGIVFTNAHTQAPLCGPSRASFMTGLLPTTTGIYLHINDKYVDDANEATRKNISLPEYFEGYGYKTMGAGKIWH